MAQYLTAVLEIRPSRRKAAAMERVRAANEQVFWRIVADLQERADVVAAIADPKERKAASRLMQAEIARTTTAGAAKAGLPEAVGAGLTRDVTGSVMSYVELRAKGHAAEWPTPVAAEAADHAAALTQFVTATTKDQEDAARDALARVSKLPGPRPLTIARARDATLLRQGPAGSIVLVLNVLRAADLRSRLVQIKPGIDASTGEVTKPERSRTKLVIPVACSKWHEQKFLAGKATLRSSLIVRRDNRWFLCAQFEMAEARKPRMTGARLGVDRGIVNPIAVAVVDREGAVIAAPPPAGSEIGRAIRKSEQRRKAEQRRRGVSSRKHARQLDHHLHHLANAIVRDAKAFGAQVVMEKLDGFKAAIRTKRAKGARRNPWQKSLKRVQLAKLETMLGYKMKLAGLPALREVFAARTSTTCIACGVTDSKSRATQEQFVCTACGFQVHADTAGAVNIARRDVAFSRHKKGGDFAALERDMVASLRCRDDGGHGPLAAGLVAANGFVAVRAAADRVHETGQPVLALLAEQKPCLAIKNRCDAVFPAGDGANSGHTKRRKRVVRQVLAQERLL